MIDDAILHDSTRPSKRDGNIEAHWTRRAFGGLVLGGLSSAGAGFVNAARSETMAATVEPDGPDHLPRRRVKVLDTEISYVDVGDGEPVVFIHGNPTWSYQWRSIIPYISPIRRCLAPDLVGMGWSGKSPSNAYRFVDHARYMDAWFDALQLTKDVTLVLHDWGAAIGFYRARRHPEQIKAIAYYEAVAHSRRWDDFAGGRDRQFRTLRSPEGERLVLDENMFVEVVLPRGILRKLTDEEMEAYRAPYRDRERRLPTLIWPRELPIDGVPEDVVAIVDENAGGWRPATDCRNCSSGEIPDPSKPDGSWSWSEAFPTSARSPSTACIICRTTRPRKSARRYGHSCSARAFDPSEVLRWVPRTSLERGDRE
jgi:haloalkane dehalogenase